MNSEKFSLTGVAVEIVGKACMAKEMSGEMSLQRIFFKGILSSDAKFTIINKGRRGDIEQPTEKTHETTSEWL